MMFRSRQDVESVPTITQIAQVAAPPVPDPAADLRAELQRCAHTELGAWLTRAEPEWLERRPEDAFIQFLVMANIRAIAKGLLEADAAGTTRPRELIDSLRELVREHLEPWIEYPCAYQHAEVVPVEMITPTVANRHLVPGVGLEILEFLWHNAGRTGWARRCPECDNAFLVTAGKQQFCSHRCANREGMRRRRRGEGKRGVAFPKVEEYDTESRSALY